MSNEKIQQFKITNPILEHLYSFNFGETEEIDCVQEYFKNLCNDEESQRNSNESLSSAEYLAKLQAEEQEFAAAMQILQFAYWNSLGLEDGDPYAIEQLRNMDIEGYEFSDAASAAIYQDAIAIREKALNNIQNENGSINEQETYDLIAQEHQNMQEAEIKKMVDEIVIS